MLPTMKKVIEQGLFTTLAQFGWRLVADGSTTIDEVDRVGMQALCARFLRACAL